MHFQWLESFTPGESLRVCPWDGDIAPLATVPDGARTACILDTETTGLDPRTCTIIEIGLRTIAYSPAGDVLGLVDSYDGLQDPGAPLPPEIVVLTGLTDMDLAGEAIDWERVVGMLKAASVCAAHKAAFDRPFVDAALRQWSAQYGLAVPRVAWVCSLDLIDWKAHGLPSSSLEVLCALHGFYTTSHRAGSDAAALARLLGMRNAESGATYLHEMLTAARVPTVIVAAVGSPFEAKDALRERGYRWDAAVKVWSRAIPASAEGEERAWLAANAYRGPMRATFTKVDLMTRYSHGA